MGRGGDGMMTFLAHVHILDATEIMVGWGGVGAGTFERSQSFDLSFHARMQILERCFEFTSRENFAHACKQKRQFSEAIQAQIVRGRW